MIAQSDKNYPRQLLLLIALSFSLFFAQIPEATSTEVEPSSLVNFEFSTTRLERRFELHITGLQQGAEYELELKSQFVGSTLWRSRAIFRANGAGIIDLRGSNAAAAERLLWSMKDSPDEQIQGFDPEVSGTWRRRGSFRITITLRNGDSIIGASEHALIFRNSNVAVSSHSAIHHQYVIYRPACRVPVPAVVLLQNGENALIHVFASLIASRGVVATIVNYAPDRMIRSHPLEQVEDAILWTKNQPDVLPAPPLLFGVSRSAELALLMAANFQGIGPVIAYHASSVAHAALGPTGVADEPAWMIGGQPIISLQKDNLFLSATREGLQRPPFRLEPRYTAMFGDPEAFLRSRIPVERINNPVLLVSGTRDAIWPAAMMANQILAARAATGGSTSTTSLVYPDAGHAIGVPNFPLGTLTFRSSPNSRPYDFGGDLLATGAASFAAWQEVSKFIDNWKHQVQRNSSQTTVEDGCRAE
jgi:pimeloyl-ACP methyl ester carboxylesterase